MLPNIEYSTVNITLKSTDRPQSKLQKNPLIPCYFNPLTPSNVFRIKRGKSSKLEMHVVQDRICPPKQTHRHTHTHTRVWSLTHLHSCGCCWRAGIHHCTRSSKSQRCSHTCACRSVTADTRFCLQRG